MSRIQRKIEHKGTTIKVIDKINYSLERKEEKKVQKNIAILEKKYKSLGLISNAPDLNKRKKEILDEIEKEKQRIGIFEKRINIFNNALKTYIARDNRLGFFKDFFVSVYWDSKASEGGYFSTRLVDKMGYGVFVNLGHDRFTAHESELVGVLIHETTHALQYKKSQIIQTTELIEQRLKKFKDKVLKNKKSILIIDKKFKNMYLKKITSQYLMNTRLFLSDTLMGFFMEGLATYSQFTHNANYSWMFDPVIIKKRIAVLNQRAADLYHSITNYLNEIENDYSFLVSNIKEFVQKYKDSTGDNFEAGLLAKLDGIKNILFKHNFYSFVERREVYEIGSLMCGVIEYADKDFKFEDFLKLNYLGFVKKYLQSCSKIGVQPAVGLDEGIFNYNKLLKRWYNVFNKQQGFFDLVHKIVKSRERKYGKTQNRTLLLQFLS